MLLHTFFKQPVLQNLCYLIAMLWHFPDTFWAQRTTPNDGTCTGGNLMKSSFFTQVLFTILLNSVPSHSADTIPPFNRCCLSCEFNCGYVDVSFSHNMQYFLLYCKGERHGPWIFSVKALFCNSKLRVCTWNSAPCHVEIIYQAGREQITSNRSGIPQISHRNKCLTAHQQTRALLAESMRLSTCCTCRVKMKPCG